MNIQTALEWYRSKIKRISLLHRFTIFVTRHFVIPLLENATHFVTPPDDPVNFRIKLLLKAWEPETVDYVKQRLRKGMVAVDVGAHVGYYTRLFAELVGPKGKVIAFEPNPETYRLLLRNIENKNNISVFPFAIGEEEGLMELFDAIIETGGSSLRIHERKRESLKELTKNELAPRSGLNLPPKTYLVEVKRADRVLNYQQFDGQIDLLKVDVEGAEVSVLRSFGDVLDKVREVICELSPDHLHSFGTSIYELLGLLKEKNFTQIGIVNYEIKWVSSREIEEFAEQMDIGEVINIVARKPE